MNNNYINNLLLSKDNKNLTIYFKDDVFNCEKDSLSINNFRLHLLSNNNYETINLKKIFKNDNNSYSLNFEIDNSDFIEKNSALLLELLSVYNNNLEKLNNYQNNNYIYLNINIPEFNDNYININVVNNNNSNKISYSNRSSPLLAYNRNLKNYYLNKIYKYDTFYGKKIEKYPSSYYSTSYSKFIKPS